MDACLGMNAAKDDKTLLMDVVPMVVAGYYNEDDMNPYCVF
jgi:hypothetical protein